MALDFKALAGGSDGARSTVIEPRKIFSTLVRHPRFKFPSANQGEVLDKWFALRERRDNTIKMNTGSGKMLVGLLALRSSLNEGAGPAVYICPDNYLADQVRQEAKDLGLRSTEDPVSAEYAGGEAILIANVWKLFNGRSVFGVGTKRIDIGTIVIDDAHACLATISEQFSIRIGAAEAAFGEVLAVFAEDIKTQSPLRLLEIEAGDPSAITTIPFWAWHAKQDRVLEILHRHRTEESLRFRWPLLKEAIHLCQCVLNGKAMEIAPRCLPLDVLPSFAAARRRIYMTATLADDGILVSKLQASPEFVADPIRPRGAGEIGDRMIVAPLEAAPGATEADVKSLVADIARTRNAVVIVPSEKRASHWADVAAQTLMAESIAEGVAALRARHVGLTVLVNRYDGVDLPDDACRLLVIDGLPETSGLVERVEANLLEGTKPELLRLIQKLEQGMGRGVRSAEDRCAVLLLGSRLTQKINQADARAMFTPATLVQMDMGRDLTRQVKGGALSDLKPILELCMDRDEAWWRAGRERLAKAPEPQPSKVDPVVVAQRAAFDFALDRRPKEAEASLQAAANAEQDPLIRGYLKLQLAEVVDLDSPGRAQEILLAASKDNRRVTKPLAGIAHVKIKPPTVQAAAVAQYLSARCIDTNQLVLDANALADDLVWDEDRTDAFEAAMQDLGRLLGFGSQRPDKEFRDGGPDNLWAVGGLKFLLIECKSGVKNDGRLISKDHCNQLLGATSWFQNSYDQSCKATPIIVQPVARFQSEASPSREMRVIDDEKLRGLRDAIRKFATDLARHGKLDDEKLIANLLAHYDLTGERFVPAHTKTYTQQT